MTEVLEFGDTYTVIDIEGDTTVIEIDVEDTVIEIPSETVVIDVGLIVSSGPGGTASTFKAYETPTPTPDGTVTTFTTPDLYVPGSLMVFLNGILERHITELSVSTFSFSTPPVFGDEIRVCYNENIL